MGAANGNLDAVRTDAVNARNAAANVRDAYYQLYVLNQVYLKALDIEEDEVIKRDFRLAERMRRRMDWHIAGLTGNIGYLDRIQAD